MKKGVDYKGQKDLSRFVFVLFGIGSLIFVVIVFAILNKSGGELRGIQNAGQTEPSDSTIITLPRVIYNLSGSVEDIDETFIVINASIFKMNEDRQIAKVTEKRTVFITAETKITELTFIPQEGTNKKLPQESISGVAEISVGDTVEVISNQNIADKQQFRATHVRILP